MAVRATWGNTLALGKETTYGTPPTLETPYWLEGNYHAMPITDISIEGKVGKSLPAAAAGVREINAYAPVTGNTRSEGDINGIVFGDSLGVLLMAALGSVSTAQTLEAANSGALASDADISDASGVITVTNPTTSAYLMIAITSAASANGAVSIALSGTDTNGNAVSETLPITLDSGDATVYSRYCYTGAITCVASGFGSGAVAITGVTKSTHTFTLASTPVSYAGINLGDAGRGTSEAATYGGMVCTGLTFEFDANAADGAITYSSSWMGEYGTYTTAPTIYPTVDRPFAAWNASFTIGGAAYYRIQRMTMNIATGNALAWSADGAQGPRFSIPGGFAVTGQMLLLSEGDTEWGYFEDNTVLNTHMTWTNGNDLLYSAVSKSCLFEMTKTYFINATTQEVDGAQAIQTDFATVYDSSDGALKATLINSVYGY